MNSESSRKYVLTNCRDRTWRGERGEEWSSAQGLESILLSIQSLMSSNPYENEPGYEDANSAEDKISQKNYVMKVIFSVDKELDRAC